MLTGLSVGSTNGFLSAPFLTAGGPPGSGLAAQPGGGLVAQPNGGAAHPCGGLAAQPGGGLPAQSGGGLAAQPGGGPAGLEPVAAPPTPSKAPEQ
jgi:hypothetical protein